MATLPAANYLTDNARTEGEFKAGLEAMLSSTKQIPGAGVAELAYTIAAGSVTPAGGGGMLVLDTESSAASDDLTNIVQTNYPDGSLLVIRNANAARVVVVKHAATGSGQMFLDRSVDLVLDDTKRFLCLQRRGTDWYEVWHSPPRWAIPVVSKSANFTATRADCGKVFECNNAITVSFEAAATLGDGWTATFINLNSSSNSVSLDPNGIETIDRQTTTVLHSQQAVTIVCDGAEFFSLTGYYRPRRTTVSFSSTLSINMLAGRYFEVAALTGNVTSLTITNSIEGERIRIRFVQDATGGRTVALPAGAKVAGSLASAANQASILDMTFSLAGSRMEGFWTQIPV